MASSGGNRTGLVMRDERSPGRPSVMSGSMKDRLSDNARVGRSDTVGRMTDLWIDNVPDAPGGILSA